MPSTLLAIALEERQTQALNRVFRRLALLYSPQDMLAAYHGVTAATPRRRGNAIEYLENALTTEHRGLVLPLVDDTGDEGRARIAEHHGIPLREPRAHARGDPQVRRLVAPCLRLVRRGARRERTLLLPLVESNLQTLNTLVRETASWARLAIASS